MRRRKARDFSGNKELDVFLATRDGNQKRLKQYLENGGDVNKAKPQTGFTLLHRAAGVGDIDECEILLTYGANINAKSTWGLLTPLHSALGNGWQETAQFLMEQGANMYLKDKYGMTAVDYAMKRGYIDQAKDFFRLEKRRERILAMNRSAEDMNRRRSARMSATDVESSVAVGLPNAASASGIHEDRKEDSKEETRGVAAAADRAGIHIDNEAFNHPTSIANIIGIK